MLFIPQFLSHLAVFKFRHFWLLRHVFCKSTDRPPLTPLITILCLSKLLTWSQVISMNYEAIKKSTGANTSIRNAWSFLTICICDEETYTQNNMKDLSHFLNLRLTSTRGRNPVCSHTRNQRFKRYQLRGISNLRRPVPIGSVVNY